MQAKGAGVLGCCWSVGTRGLRWKGGQWGLPFPPERERELSVSLGVTQHTEDTGAQTPVVTVGSGQVALERGQRLFSFFLAPFFPLQATSVLHLRFSCYISLNNFTAYVCITKIIVLFACFKKSI